VVCIQKPVKTLNRWKLEHESHKTDITALLYSVYVRTVSLLMSERGRLVEKRNIAGIPRQQFPRIILARHVRHAPFPRDALASSSRGCHEESARKLLPWNLRRIRCGIVSRVTDSSVRCIDVALTAP